MPISRGEPWGGIEVVPADMPVAADDRAAGVVKEKIDPELGLTRKLVVKDAAKNKLKLDLKKSTFSLKMKSLPGFDPTDGDVRIRIVLSTGAVDVTVPGTPNGKGNKYKLGPAEGTFQENR